MTHPTTFLKPLKIWYLKAICLLLTMASAMYATANDGNLDPATDLSFLVANPNNLRPGEIAFVHIILKNPNIGYSTMEAHFLFPEGWTAVEFSQADAGIGTKTKKAFIQIIPESRADETNNHDAFSATGAVPSQTPNIFGWVLMSAANEQIETGDDAIAVFAIKIPDNAELGDFTIVAQDIWLSTGNPGGTGDGGIDPFSFTITVNPNFVPGDVNNDGNINVTDYVATASYILEQNPQPFVFEAADLDENGSITVSDLVGVAGLVLNYEGTPLLAPQENMNVTAQVDMEANVTYSENSRTEVTIMLDNSIDLTAMQMDLRIPQGMKLVGASLTDRATSNHQLELAELTNGDYRLLAASNMRKAFNGNEGALLTLTLEGEPHGNVLLTGIEVATPQAMGCQLEDIMISMLPTGVQDMNQIVRIYGESGNIVIESPIDGMAQIVLPNGISQTVTVKAGRNVYPCSSTGLVIVRMNATAAKILF